MSNFTRIPDEIRKSTNLTTIEKVLLGYLITYQQTPEGVETKNYCFLKQAELAIELGESLSTTKRTIQSLIKKGLIFLGESRKYNKTGKQYKNRKATIFVDKFNPLPIKNDIKIKASKEVKEEININIPEVIENIVKNEIIDEEINIEIEQPKENKIKKLMDLEFNTLLAIKTIENDEDLLNIFKDDCELPFTQIKELINKNELDKNIESLIQDYFDRIILTKKEYVNYYNKLLETK